ncbi:MAG: hypothetical protein NXI04_24165 [Planctomycetaceae bacterium]|nr:hypothetical protein [Planctomycetaceae bacterium]
MRAFATAVLVLELLWSLQLAVLSFWVASDGSTLRGLLAACGVFLLCGVSTVTLAAYFSAQVVIRQAVEEAALGRAVLHGLFRRVLGVTDPDSGEEQKTPRVPVEMSREDVERVLNDAAGRLLSEDGPVTRWGHLRSGWPKRFSGSVCGRPFR